MGSFSINTNIASLEAQNYLRMDENFQTQTINEVTSGYRIVNSGDDAAGLAIANADASNEAVLTQGIQNANDGLSQLQIADGGLSNISQLLDRARTLATESASDAFTGDRGVLNSEFQSVIQEVNRQAQAIGLNQGGQFATDLQVFVGGGTASNGISATTNGTVSVNLAGATVDAKSLGLEGVQATNANSQDLSASSNTSVQAIVQDANNAVPNDTTTFYFSGAGFSGSNAVAVNVNLSGVTDTNTLVAAINQGIQNAGNGSTAAATAFQNANITASVVNTEGGGQAIAFNSSNTAFQVQAGDVMANALLGNTVSANSPDGAAISSTFTGGSNASAAALTGAATVQISGGGLASPVDIDLSSGATIGTLQSDIANNAQLEAAGISLTTATGGSPLVFTSSTGKQLSVTAAGDTADVLGVGSYQYGASNAVTYNSVTAGAQYNDATATGTADLQFGIDGTPSSVLSVNLAGGDATSGSVTGTVDLSSLVATPLGTDGEKLAITVDGGAAQDITLTKADTANAAGIVNDINSQLVGATASLSFSGGHSYLQITSDSKGAGSSVTIANDTGTALGDVFGAAGATGTGTSQSLTSIVSGLNQAIAGNSQLQAAGIVASQTGGKLVFSSSNGTEFQLAAYGSTAGGADPDLGFGTTGAAAVAGTQGASGLAAYDSNGAYQTGPIAFSGLGAGNDTQSITISANNSSGQAQPLTIQLQNNASSQNGADIDAAVNAINSALQKSNNPALQGITAVVDNSSGTEKINLISTNAFTVAVGSTADGTGLQSQGTTQTAAVVGSGSTADISTVATATAAVNTLADAVTALGNAQAAVGRGENEFNYAINLANSQLTNLSAAESDIRDANMASESANLTQSSIQLQAGIAALAQANSAPEQILTLLQK